MKYLNEEFSNSSPEPINYQWTVGQMVIVQYHLDKKWYRGTIIKVSIVFIYMYFYYFDV